jgi:hypothetical protein
MHSSSSEFTIGTTVVFPFVVICNGDIIIACLSDTGGTQILYGVPEFSDVPKYNIHAKVSVMNFSIFLLLI